MKTSQEPYIIDFPKIGSSQLGYISVAERELLPYAPKRIYWTYFTPEDVERGGHGHINLQQILVAVAGKIDVTIECESGERFEFSLNSPDKGLYVPKKSWRTMKYSHNAVQMCIASMEYDEADYIRDYTEFIKLRK
jgi:hypothetical protein